ncbi:MAG: protein kinase [Chloroflexota bacterium]
MTGQLNDLSGQTPGNYQLVKKIGSGGMGAVYRGHPVGSDTEVAIKIMMTAGAADIDPNYLERFEQEIRITSQLNHPNIVTFYDSGTEGDISYAVMKLLKGGSLDQRMRYIIKNSMPLPKIEGVVAIVRQIASALDYAHASGVYHRDVKPNNIMFDDRGTPYIVDFGIAKIAEETSRITGTGIAVGTPTYMSPEQWRGESARPATDQYALACVAYYMLTGKPPFNAPNMLLMMRQHTQEIAPPPHKHRPELSTKLEMVFLKALAKEPEDRYPSVSDFAAALEAAALRDEAVQDIATEENRAGFIKITNLPKTERLGKHAPLNDDELLRNTIRQLFASAYGHSNSALKRQVAYRTMSKQADDALSDVLLQDLIRGGFAELVLRYLLGDVLDTIILYIQSGNALRARDVMRRAGIDPGALADLLGQDINTLVSNHRVQSGAAANADATADLVNQSGAVDTLTSIISRTFGSEGETRRIGVEYLKELNAAAAVPQLLKMLDDDARTPIDLMDLMEVLTHIGDHAALPALRRLAQAHETPQVRGMATMACVYITEDFAGNVEGVARPWGEMNPRLAEQVIMMFGDVTDLDELLLVMVRDSSGKQRNLAAAALGMSGNADYALPIARHLMTDDTEKSMKRWRHILRCEHENPHPIITDTMADGLRNTVQETTLKPLTDDSMAECALLMRAVATFNNERSAEALGGIASNSRYDARLREAATKALERMA